MLSVFHFFRFQNHDDYWEFWHSLICEYADVLFSRNNIKLPVFVMKKRNHDLLKKTKLNYDNRMVVVIIFKIFVRAKTILAFETGVKNLNNNLRISLDGLDGFYLSFSCMCLA